MKKKIAIIASVVLILAFIIFLVFGKIDSIEGTWIEANNSPYGTLKDGKAYSRGLEIGYYEKVSNHKWVVYLDVMHKKNPKNPIDTHYITAGYFSISTGKGEQPLYCKETTNEFLMKYIYDPLKL